MSGYSLWHWDEHPKITRGGSGKREGVWEKEVFGIFGLWGRMEADGGADSSHRGPQAAERIAYTLSGRAGPG